MSQAQCEKTEGGSIKPPLTGATKDSEWKIDFEWLQSVQNQIGLDDDLSFVALETIEAVLLASITVHESKVSPKQCGSCGREINEQNRQISQTILCETCY